VRIGIVVRNMGPQAEAETLASSARVAEDAGLDSIWVVDHVAIPPDDAEGSGGRYLDPLATLAFLAGCTRRIGLGTSVLVLPYRPALPTAKWIATLQELSGGRLLLGVGVGWMAPEFRALGVERSRRGALTDEVLTLLERCFADDEVEWNGQRFLFRPRPPRPPILVGGAPPQAIRRAARFGAGWMPMGGEPEDLAPHVRELRAQVPDAEVVVLTALPLGDPAQARRRLDAYRDAGVTRVVHGAGRVDLDGFARAVDGLAALTDAG
jgi:probable F420-dependent oxidoreductase